MTIIVATKDGMVADSSQAQGELMFQSAYQKICRNKEGWLAACAGSCGPGQTFRLWFMESMKAPRPHISDDSFSALLVSPDGRVWRWDAGEGGLYQVASPTMLGEPTAEAFVCGAMVAGASPEDALELACEHCVWARGPVQVESLK